jgi:hypothetical protein
MPTTKIHCTFLEVWVPDWAGIPQDQVDCLINQIENMQLLGGQPELRGFVGTRRIGNAVGGFFSIQYQDIKEYYERDKHRVLRLDSPSTSFR